MTARVGDTPIEIGLAAAIVAVERDAPTILVSLTPGEEDGLPYGQFDPIADRTLEIALRAFVSDQTGLSLGYVEQLYTFGDRGRHATPDDLSAHIVSIGYLALTRIASPRAAALPANAAFRSWYRYFPWEDWRGGRPAMLDAVMLPALEKWAGDKESERTDTRLRALTRTERLNLCFGNGSSPWDEENVLERYELLYEAGLLFEAARDGRDNAGPLHPVSAFGDPMRHDHRRILATAMGRLRAKLKYRPVVFELMPAEFTLTILQRTVEAISGRHLHKQNFRRLVENGALVEPTGGQTTTKGRPAALFRFRRNVIQERPAPGLRGGKR